MMRGLDEHLTNEPTVVCECGDDCGLTEVDCCDLAVPNCETAVYRNVYDDTIEVVVCRRGMGHER